MKKTLIAILGLGLLIACQKEEAGQKPYSDSYLFYAYANIDGYPVNYNAGEKGYAMFTTYKMVDSVLEMRGTLAIDSAQPRQAFQIKFRAAQKAAVAANVNLGPTLQKGARALADASGQVRIPHVYDFSFRPDTLYGHSAFMWHYNGQNYYGDSLALTAIDAQNHSVLEVELSNSGIFSCTPSVKHRISTNQICKAFLQADASSPNNITAEIKPLVGQVSQVKWWVNGSITHQEGLALSSLVAQSNLPMRLKAEVHFESGCVETIEKTILPGRTDCDLNLTYQREAAKVSNPYNLNTVEIVYYDESGMRYTSNYANNSGSFSIESMNNYEEELGRGKHQRFMFSGSAVLKATNGQTVQMQNFYGSFAVAHP